MVTSRGTVSWSKMEPWTAGSCRAWLKDKFCPTTLPEAKKALSASKAVSAVPVGIRPSNWMSWEAASDRVERKETDDVKRLYILCVCVCVCFVAVYVSQEKEWMP